VPLLPLLGFAFAHVGTTFHQDGSVDANGWPLTRAERTDYKETSHYTDVIAFIETLQHKGAPISVQYIGASKEGRRMPLVIAARPMVASAAEARRSGKPIIYIQANIHAGEVEGKEAALHILRRLSQEGPGGVLDRAILLFDPIYNIDGNEKFGPMDVNRPEQNGPESVGLRSSGEGFDLNRDGMKAESLEFRALLANLWNTWDPDVMMDLHTTDGTRHGYELTYAPPLNPNTAPGIVAFTRDEMLPRIRRDIRQHWGQELFDYGDTENRNKKQVWATFEEGGRYMTNYAGLRNRIGILSEATTYIPFKDRVVVTDHFVMSCLDYILQNSRRVMQLTRDADAQVAAWGANPSTAPELGVQFAMGPGREEEVLLEPDPGPGKKRPFGRPEQIVKVKMPIYERFVATQKAKLPAGYLIPADQTKIVELLRRHGIVVEQVKQAFAVNAQTFTAKDVRVAGRPFQGHRLIQINGTFAGSREYAKPGAFLVRTSQPLGMLIFNLLEPESSDGVETWGFLGNQPKAGDVYPILKVMDPVSPVTERVP